MERSGNDGGTTTTTTVTTTTTTTDDGHCQIHTTIQIKRRMRNGEWLHLMKKCPLCTADDDDSVWSSYSGGSSTCSPRLNRISPRLQMRKRLASSVGPTIPSRFKESKDGDEQHDEDSSSSNAS